MRGRNCQAQKEAARDTTHCSYVAQGPSQAFPSHGVGRMLVSKEMCAFQKPVASQDKLMPSSRPQQRGVVTDAKAHFARGMPAPPQGLLDARNQFVLARCHDKLA